ncbi:MAG: Methyltransferase type 11 [Lacunisphaera sp.]|nr:Methyltransferase type 11 [Lacunisphaera sp.]
MPAAPSTEGFQPRAHWAPTTPWRRALYELRLLGDLQTNSIRADLADALADFRGALLDVGCGNSPFRHLLDPAHTRYQGADVQAAADFGYHNPDVVYFDGRVLPFPDASFEAVLCTEVLEHVAAPAEIIREMHRVLKPGGLLLVTIPWSARFHYQPLDYHRYTPSMLAELFAGFATPLIKPRGTDFSSIASKIVVAYARNVLALRPTDAAGFLAWPFRLIAAIVAFPVLLLALLLGHGGIRWGWGSSDDPLGYTVIARK